MRATERFERYVEPYLEGDESYRRNIRLKLEHSKRVFREIHSLGRELGLNEEELELADLMGLYHDIGRFEQYRRYETFVDARSEDHASLGVGILKGEGLLDHLTEDRRELILQAIELHNKAELPSDLPERTLWFARLLRDADKLDIWKVVTDYYEERDGEKNSAIELDLPDRPEISPPVYEDLLNRRPVAFSHMATVNDFKLLQMGWIFDLNFEASIYRARNRGYVEKIRATLPDLPEAETIYSALVEYMDELLAEYEPADGAARQ